MECVVEDIAHWLSKCTVCDSPTTVPTNAARATATVARENCMIDDATEARNFAEEAMSS